MHPKHCETEATPLLESASEASWQSHCARETWSASPLPPNSGRQNNNADFIDFSSPYPPSVLSKTSAAMHRLVEASLGSPGHQGAADYVRYTEHHGAMGFCAGGVEEAIRRAGLGIFHADAYALDELLAKSSHWQEVHIAANQIKSLPPGYVVVMENTAGKQHAFISTGNGLEASDWHGSMSQDQLLPLVLDGQAEYRVFRPAGHLTQSIPDSVPEESPQHHLSEHQAPRSPVHYSLQPHSSGGSWTLPNFSGFGPSSDTNSNSSDASESPSPTSNNSEASESPQPDPNSSDLPLGAPDSYFMTQFRSSWNPNGQLRSEDCGPASLAMFMLHANKFPPGSTAKNRAQLVQAVRQSMTGRNIQEGTTEAEVRKGAAAAGIKSHIINGMAGLEKALAKGEMVVARGNPGASGSYGDKLSNSQYSHFEGAHFILVDGRHGNNYIINDPLSRTGSREITASQMKAYMHGLGGEGSGVALSP